MSAENPTTHDLLTAARKVAVRRQMHRNAVDHKLRAETACDAAADALADAMRDLDELLAAVYPDPEPYLHRAAEARWLGVHGFTDPSVVETVDVTDPLHPVVHLTRTGPTGAKFSDCCYVTALYPFPALVTVAP